MRNVLLKIKYDGSAYCGWQRQPGQKTVCGRLEEVFAIVCKQDVKLEATSRTDAGVHAYGQMATLRGDFGIPADRIPITVNTLLATDRVEGSRDIEIVWAKDMPEGFHARFDSQGKRYIYKIKNSPEYDIFVRNSCYQVKKPLDIAKMKSAADIIKGEHDFAAFMSMGSTPQDSTVRNIYTIDVSKEGEYITIKVEGNAFLYNMVRIISGTLVEAGSGKRSLEDIKTAIETGDRTKAGHIAPAQGLYLDEVFYGQTILG